MKKIQGEINEFLGKKYQKEIKNKNIHLAMDTQQVVPFSQKY